MGFMPHRHAHRNMARTAPEPMELHLSLWNGPWAYGTAPEPMELPAHMTGTTYRSCTSHAQLDSSCIFQTHKMTHRCQRLSNQDRGTHCSAEPGSEFLLIIGHHVWIVLHINLYFIPTSMKVTIRKHEYHANIILEVTITISDKIHVVTDQ